MVKPGLKVAGRCFHDNSRGEALNLHPLNGLSCQIIYEAQVMFTIGPDVDISAVRVLVTQP